MTTTPTPQSGEGKPRVKPDYTSLAPDIPDDAAVFCRSLDGMIVSEEDWKGIVKARDYYFNLSQSLSRELDPLADNAEAIYKSTIEKSRSTGEGKPNEALSPQPQSPQALTSLERELLAALKGMIKAFAWKAHEQPSQNLQSDVRRALAAIKRAESQTRQGEKEGQGWNMGLRSWATVPDKGEQCVECGKEADQYIEAIEWHDQLENREQDNR